MAWFKNPLKTKLLIWKGRILLSGLFFEKKIAALVKVQVFHRRHLRYLIKRTVLFDAEHYLEMNTDVNQQGFSPLHHYAVWGDKEGRNPMPLFDPKYYRTQCQSKLKAVNALLHYVYIGRYLGLSPSPWFDINYYLQENKDVARSGVEPLQHYLTWGGIEGRSPCPQFNGLYYLESNPEVAEAKVNPLLHYLRSGRVEERCVVPKTSKILFDTENTAITARIDVLDLSVWQELVPVETNQATVDVIIPVYKGYVETLRCIYSVLTAANELLFELIVIDDASPDAELVAKLNQLSELKLFTLLINTTNVGFVSTVNRGMACNSKRNVVLLNSDTEVYPSWLDRLHAAAFIHGNTGTVTPLSNNATICSYPLFLHDNPYPLELEYKFLDKIASEVNVNATVITPTAVGFCMYIKRACLIAVGEFDVAAFGKGYGEENDFCQRAIQQGWQNIIAANVFVRHWGETSFQGEKSQRIGAALKIVNQRYPNYQTDVEQFIQQDPLLVYRQRLDWARMQRFVKSENILIVSHNRGGGSERSVQENILRLNQAGHGVFLMRPMQGNKHKVILKHPLIRSLCNYQAIDLANTETLVIALKALNITAIHVHSLVDFLPHASEIILALAHEINAPVDVYVHDYKAICPRINLVDQNGFYCGEPEIDVCNSCLKTRGSSFDVLDINVWRAMRGALFSQANKVIVPDEDVKIRLENYFPTIDFNVAPHEAINSQQIQLQPPVIKSHEKLKIVVIGGVGKIKGYEVLLACAQDAKKRKLPLEFLLMGYSLNDKTLQKFDVKITGRYLDSEAQAYLTRLQAHIVWLPSLWPETYSYTLSLALAGGYQVATFDLGAIARRLHAINAREHLMPLQMSHTPHIINDHFVNYLKHCQSLLNTSP